jgi:hypothetical protein
MTMLGAINQTGGGYYALARHAAGAFLSAVALEHYEYTPADVKEIVNDAFESCNPSEAVTKFEQALIDHVCPLN